jgi:hypothetical protein
VADLPPLFSFVATSRNDDHGGDVLRRTQSFVSRLAEQAERHRVRCELLLVEWNPPEARIPLGHALDWPAGTPFFSAKVVTATRELHRSHRNSIPLQMFQMIAKNVGIRRAAGDYVIATNIDIIFSDELFAFLKTAPLERDVLYRSDRWDIPNALQLEPSLDSILSRARRETIRKNLRDGTYVRQPDGTFENSTRPAYEAYFVDPIRGELDKLLWRITKDPADTEGLKTAIGRVRNEFLEDQRRFAAAPLLHTNGCGDFTMLSRYAWGRLRGYPEWHIFSWAIDSVLLFQAHYNGIRVEELPTDATHYHIEHDYGSGWSPEGAASLWERVERVSIPYLTMDDSRRLALELQDNAAAGLQTVYCPLNWGFADHLLPEETVAAPGLTPIGLRGRNEGPLEEDPTRGMVRTRLAVAEARRTSLLMSLETRREDGREFHRLSTRGPPWGYALTWDLGRRELKDEFWVEIRVRARRGRAGLCVLNHDDTDFVTQSYLTPREDFERLQLRIRPSARATLLVCRNAGDEEAEVDIEDIAILEPPAADPDRSGPDPADLRHLLQHATGA